MEPAAKFFFGREIPADRICSETVGESHRLYMSKLLFVRVQPLGESTDWGGRQYEGRQFEARIIAGFLPKTSLFMHAEVVRDISESQVAKRHLQKIYM